MRFYDKILRIRYPRILPLLAVVLCTFLSVHFVWGYEDDPFYDSRGYSPARECFHSSFHEHIDPFTGNVLLTYIDIYLPGKGGLDLKIIRTYNSRILRKVGTGGQTLIPHSWVGIGWSLHMGRLIEALGPHGSYVIEMPDGSKHPAFVDKNVPSRWITKDYWILEQSGQYFILTLNDGVKYTFDGSMRGQIDGCDYMPTTKIEDTHGNTITIEYYPTQIQYQYMIDKITDTYGRQIIFNHSTSELKLNSIKVHNYYYHFYYQSHLYRNHLIKVEPPTGDSWEYDYTTSGTYRHELTKVTYPWGGSISYTFETDVFIVGGDTYRFRVINTQTVNPGGTWTLNYQRSATNHDRITMTAPDGTDIRYAFYGYYDVYSSGDNWRIGQIIEKRISGSGGTQIENYTWVASDAISNDNFIGPWTTDNYIYIPLLSSKSITRDGKIYTTSYSNYDDYGNAKTIAETGDLSRTIQRTYWYNTSSHIVDRLKSETIGSFIKSYDYYSNGKMKSKSIYGVTTTYQYYSNGNLQRETNARGYSTIYSNYSWGIAKTIQNPIYTITRTVEWYGRIINVINGRGNTTSFTYDGLNRITEVDPPVGNDINIAYTTSYKEVSRGGSWTKQNYDGLGRVTSTVNSQGVKRDINYNNMGYKTYESYPYIGANIGDHFQYDYLGRLKRVTHPDNTTVQFTHSGAQVTVKDERNNTTVYEYEAFGEPDLETWLTGVIVDGKTTNYSYNDAGSLTHISGVGGSKTYTYNLKNFMITQINPESGQTSYQHDQVGNITKITDNNSNEISCIYDGINRLTSINYPGNDQDVAISYNNADSRTLMITPICSDSFVYDDGERLTQKSFAIGGQTYTVQYTHDGNDNIRCITYPDNTTVNYTYDSENRLLQVPGYINTNIMYHPSGWENNVTYANGRTTNKNYNNRYWTSSITVGSSIMNYQYTYDGTGNLTYITDNIGSNDATFSYDALNRMIGCNGSWGNGSYNYSNSGNRKSETFNGQAVNYTYSNSRLMSASGAITKTFEWSSIGSLTKAYLPDGKYTYTYDHANRVSSVNKSDLNGNPLITSLFVYAGNGLRVRKEVQDYQPPEVIVISPHEFDNKCIKWRIGYPMWIEWEAEDNISIDFQGIWLAESDGSDIRKIEDVSPDIFSYTWVVDADPGNYMIKIKAWDKAGNMGWDTSDVWEATTELVFNPSFEKGLTCWTPYGNGEITISSNAYSGDSSAHLLRAIADTGLYFGIYQDSIPCIPNTQYWLTACVKADALSGVPRISFGRWHTHPDTNHHNNYSCPVNSGWNYIYGSWTSRDYEDFLRITLYGNKQFAGDVWFDDIRLIVDTQPPEVTALYPNGDEHLEIGESYDVTVFASDNVWIDSIRVWFHPDFGVPPNGYTPNLLPTIYPDKKEGEFITTLLVPEYIPPRDNCRIYARAYDCAGNQKADTSDNNFSICYLTSDLAGATAFNNSRKMVIDLSGNIHIVFSDSNGIYISMSCDDGKTWTKKSMIYSGRYPCLIIDEHDGKNVLWIHNISLYFWRTAGKREGGRTDPLRVILTELDRILSPPALCVASNDTAHVVVEVYTDPEIMPYSWYLKYGKFIIDDPDAVVWEILDSCDLGGGQPMQLITSPSIDCDPEGNPYIVWRRHRGDYAKEIFYMTKTEDGWTVPFNVSESPLVNSVHPFVDVTNEKVYIVWDEDGEIILREGDLSIGPIEPPINISSNPEYSTYPQILDGEIILWEENYEIFKSVFKESSWGGCKNISNTSQESKHPQFVFEKSESIFLAGWTEGNISPYEVKTKLIDITPPTPPQGLSGIWEYFGRDLADITLNWNLNPESDLLGYYVYRSESSSGPFDNIGTAEPLEIPVFVDRVYAWKPYWYYVTALDTLQNESDPSDTIRVDPEYYPGPCPFLFTWNGSELMEDNNILVGSGQGEVVTDPYKLIQSLIETEPPRRYKLEIREEETEHSFFDIVSLKIIDHLEDVEIGVNVENEIMSVSIAHTPVSAISGGEDYTDVLSNDTTWFEGCEGDTMVVEFGIIDEVDDKELWLESDKSGYPISIEIEGEDDWVYVTSVFPRENFSTIPVTSLSELIEDGESLTLRLIWFSNHNLKTIRIVQPGDELLLERTSPLVFAIHSRLGNVIQKLLNEDEDYVEVLPGDTLRLEFAFLPEIPDCNRSFVFISNGYYTKETGDGGTQTATSDIPLIHSLSLYPNPAKNDMTIRFGLPKEERVSLKVYDISGREVKTLENRRLKAGYYTIRLVNMNLPSGIYFARLATDSYEETKKLVLMK